MPPDGISCRLHRTSMRQDHRSGNGDVSTSETGLGIVLLPPVMRFRRAAGARLSARGLRGDQLQAVMQGEVLE
jgi:hypothetical protein